MGKRDWLCPITENCKKYSHNTLNFVICLFFIHMLEADTFTYQCNVY